MSTATSLFRVFRLEKLRWAFAVAFTAFLLCGAGLLTNVAPAGADPYTYTVTVNAGREGVLNPNGIAVPSNATISGDDQHLRITGLNYGDRISFLGNIATTDADSEYYVRGVRYGGRDGNTSLAELSFEVTEDRDYVVAFARANELVPYTVQYVKTTGEPLYEEQIYYGNVGDKPVVACLYFDGYQPRAYNITKTLDADPQKNILTFVYDPITLADPKVEGSNSGTEQKTPSAGSGNAATGSGTDAGQAGNTSSSGTDGTVTPGQNTPNETAPVQGDTTVPNTAATSGENGLVLATNNGGGNPAPAAYVAGNAGAGVPADGALSAEETIDDNANPLAATEQLADLDEIEDNANPLAFISSVLPSGSSQNVWSSPWALGLGSAVAVLILILVIWLVYDFASQRTFAKRSKAASANDSGSTNVNDDSEKFF